MFRALTGLSMSVELQRTLLVWVISAAILGPLLARSSIRRSPIYGGIVAHGFHFVGAFLMVAVIPAIIAALIFGGGIELALPLAAILMLGSLFVLILFAIVEKPALQAHQLRNEDRGWTEEDARASRL